MVEDAIGSVQDRRAAGGLRLAGTIAFPRVALMTIPGSRAGLEAPTGRMRRDYIRVPVVRPLGPAQKLRLAAQGLLLSPLHAARARRRGVPGLEWRRHAMRLGLPLLLRGARGVPRTVLYRLVLFPMDSTRYFEFGTLGEWLAPGTASRYLDVSSPRLFPLVVVDGGRAAEADLVNPHGQDAALTEALVRAAGLEGRCRVHRWEIEAAPFAAGSFDLVTSISVLEHIPRDREAVGVMWRLLRTGGRLLLTVPCAAENSEQYIDRDEYGLLAPDAGGFVFWQRFYDDALLERNVFSVTGPPSRRAVYGERVPGSFQANAARKRSDPAYPFWREPTMMAREYSRFDRIADLPGEGVVALEFVKS